MAALYDAALAPVGINVAQFAMLRSIRRNQPVSLTELAKLHELDRSTMGRNVRVVERLGLVVTGQGEDMRENVVTLSEAGLATLQRAEPLWEQCQSALTRRLGAARLRMLREMNELM